MPSPRRSSRPDPLFDSAWATAGEIAAAVTAGRVSATTVIEDALARITQRDPVLNSFTDVLADRARKRAAAVDAAKKKGPLAGVPFAVKNLFDVKGLPTRAGSKINRELAPSGYDQKLIERLEAAGAVLVGALNMGEYAYDFTGENVHDGNAHNPHDVTRMTGGSSSGSGAQACSGNRRGQKQRSPRRRAVRGKKPVRRDRPADARGLQNQSRACALGARLAAD
jgi:Asp-tRNA(Asn)/Glu-tRNA(Gln) amidotransferase A subunit family amidase